MITSDLAPRRSPRLLLAFLLGTGLLLVGSASLTIWLTTSALERRVGDELVHTSRLLGGSGFPLNDLALTRVADYVEAEVVVLDREGRLLARSERAERYLGSLARLRGLRAGAEPHVGTVELAGQELTVGVAALPPGPRPGAGGTVFVLYRGDLVAAEARRAYVPLLAVGSLAALLACALGVFLERRVQAEHTGALVRLLASVAHEVRNPLGGIRSLARGLSVRRADGREELELIASEAERLAHLADSLRAVGLPVRTQRRPADPDALVEGALRVCQGQLAHRRVLVERALAPLGTHSVEADPDQVRQVVLNLVLNAADAQPGGGRVHLGSSAVGGSWQLLVRDEGPGVAPELRARLFQPFVTGKPKGLGVGLYLSRRLAEANGATLELLPAEEGAGACFALTWPLGEATPSAVAAEH